MPRPVSAGRAGGATSTTSSLPRSSYRTRSPRADLTHRTPMSRGKTRGGSRVWTPMSRRGRKRPRPRRRSAPRRPRRVCPPVTPARRRRVSSRSADARVPTHRSRASCLRARSPAAPICRRPRLSRTPRSRRRRLPNVPRSRTPRRRAPRRLPPNGPRSRTPHSRLQLAPRRLRANGPRILTRHNRVRLAPRKHRTNGPQTRTPHSRVRPARHRHRPNGPQVPTPLREPRRPPQSDHHFRTRRHTPRKVRPSVPRSPTHHRRARPSDRHAPMHRRRLRPSDRRFRTRRHAPRKVRPSVPRSPTHHRRAQLSDWRLRTRRHLPHKVRLSDPPSPMHRRRLRHVARSPPRIGTRPKALRGRLFRRRPPRPVAHRGRSTGTRRRSPTARRRGWPGRGPNKEPRSSRSVRRCPNLLHRKAPRHPRRSSRFRPPASKHRWEQTAHRRGWPRRSPMSRPRGRPNRRAGGRNFRRPLENSPKAPNMEPPTRHAPDRSTPGPWPSADRARPRRRIVPAHWTRAARPARFPRRAVRSVCPCRTTPHRRHRPPRYRARTECPGPTG